MEDARNSATHGIALDRHASARLEGAKQGSQG